MEAIHRQNCWGLLNSASPQLPSVTEKIPAQNHPRLHPLAQEVAGSHSSPSSIFPVLWIIIIFCFSWENHFWWLAEVCNRFVLLEGSRSDTAQKSGPVERTGLGSEAMGPEYLQPGGPKSLPAILTFCFQTEAHRGNRSRHQQHTSRCAFICKKLKNQYLIFLRYA